MKQRTLRLTEDQDAAIVRAFTAANMTFAAYMRKLVDKTHDTSPTKTYVLPGTGISDPITLDLTSVQRAWVMACWAQGRKINAIKYLRESFNGLGLRQCMLFVEELWAESLPAQEPEVADAVQYPIAYNIDSTMTSLGITPAQIAQVLAYKASNKKIAAIKHLRTTFGLRDAKNIVESLWDGSAGENAQVDRAVLNEVPRPLPEELRLELIALKALGRKIAAIKLLRSHYAAPPPFCNRIGLYEAKNLVEKAWAEDTTTEYLCPPEG